MKFVYGSMNNFLGLSLQPLFSFNFTIKGDYILKQLREELVQLDSILYDEWAFDIDNECRMIMGIVLDSPLNQTDIQCNLDDYEVVYQALPIEQKNCIEALIDADLGLIISEKNIQMRRRWLEWHLYKYINEKFVWQITSI